VCQSDLGFGTAGGAVLSVCGEALASGNTAELRLSQAPPNTPAWIALGPAFAPTPLFGGMAVPVPPSLIAGVVTDAVGAWSLPGIPGGGGPFAWYAQALYLDTSLPTVFGFSNAVRLDYLP
jgi:hypothetical protein